MSIDLSRRGFLRGLAALAATSSMVPPAVALAPPVPTPLPKLWGNGIEDDTEALQALIDHVADTGGGTVYIPRGVFKISRTLYIRAGVTNVIGDHTRIEMTAKGRQLFAELHEETQAAAAAEWHEAKIREMEQRGTG